MHLILTGATGLVGSAVLHAMLRNPRVDRITVFARSECQQALDTNKEKRCDFQKHTDFSIPPDAETMTRLELNTAHGIVWALGVSTNEVDKQSYQKITFDYPNTWARALAEMRATQPDQMTGGDALGAQVSSRPSDAVNTPDAEVSPSDPTSANTPTLANDPSDQNPSTIPQSSPLNFVYVSGEGATQTPGPFTPRYGRIKGMAEQSLLGISGEDRFASALSVYCPRPGAVDRRGHSEIAPYAATRKTFQRKMEPFMPPVLAVMKYVAKDSISPTSKLGDALVELALSEGKPLPEGEGISGDGRILGNVALRRMADL